MKKKDLLYEFIHSLNKNEVSFFKKYVQLFGKGKTPTYYIIFEQILKSKQFDEEALKKKIGASYAVHKNQLFERLISALSAYNSQEDPIAKSLDYLTVASMAAKKQLYSTADYLVDKAEKSMSGHPALTIPLFVKHFKMLLLKSPHQINGDVATANQLFAEIKKDAENYLIHHELNLLAILIYNLGRSKKDEKWKDLLKAIENNKWVQNYSSITNPIDQLNAIKLKYKVALLKNDSAQAYELQQREIKIIEANESLIRLNPMNYLVPLHNFIDVSINIEKYNEAEESLTKMNDLAIKYGFKNNSALTLAIKTYQIPLESKLIASLNLDSKANDRIDEILSDAVIFESTNEQASLAHQTNFYCAIAKLKLEKYNDALGLLAIFEYENHDKKILPEFEFYVEIMRLICFYELEFVDMFEAKIRSVSRKTNTLDSQELLPFFRALNKSISKQDALKLVPEKLNFGHKIFENLFQIWLSKP